MNALNQKILLLLGTGVALSLAYTPRQYWRTTKAFSRDWKKINKKELQNGIRNLKRTNFIKKINQVDGSVKIILTEKGRAEFSFLSLINVKPDKRNWDGKWRMFAFDIPERLKKGRDALRYKIRQIGFRELHKSVFVIPYPCEKEIKTIVDFFGIKKYVHIGVLESIDNESELKKVFGLE